MGLNLRVKRLQVDGRTLLAGLDLEIPGGCIHTLMGPSGCGKSSLLAAISGTLDPALDWDGEVRLHGRVLDGLPAEQRRVGILFQDDLLFAHMTVRENLLFALPAGPSAQREAAVLQALAELEIPGLGDANPATLSGGQRTRVALMRALLAQPEALLLDEPFARLDQALRERMRELVFAQVRQRGIPVLLVTHDAADVADTGRLTRL